jgi:hypothetical protein
MVSLGRPISLHIPYPLAPAYTATSHLASIRPSFWVSPSSLLLKKPLASTRRFILSLHNEFDLPVDDWWRRLWPIDRVGTAQLEPFKLITALSILFLINMFPFLSGRP